MTSFRCPTCNKTFKDKHRLKAHQNTVHVPKRCPCPECGKLFKTRHRVQAHRLRLHEVPDELFKKLSTEEVIQAMEKRLQHTQNLELKTKLSASAASEVETPTVFKEELGPAAKPKPKNATGQSSFGQVTGPELPARPKEFTASAGAKIVIR